MRKIAVIVNAASGTVKKMDETDLMRRIRNAFGDRHVTAEVRMVPGSQVVSASLRACDRGCDIVVVGGGDGTVGGVAGALAGSDTLLGILPLGTLNHFARDLKVPFPLEDAVELIVSGNDRQVDLAEVNGRYFLNTSSVGAYPRWVERRDCVRTHQGHGKWLALVLAAWQIGLHRARIRAWLEINGESHFRHTPFVFVGNNTYSLRLFERENRARLDEGILSVISPSQSGMWCYGRLAWRAWRGRLNDADALDSWAAPEIRLRPEREHLRVALDGEVVRMRGPLHYRLHPRRLRVIAPPAQP